MNHDIAIESGRDALKDCTDSHIYMEENSKMIDV